MDFDQIVALEALDRRLEEVRTKMAITEATLKGLKAEAESLVGMAMSISGKFPQLALPKKR